MLSKSKKSTGFTYGYSGHGYRFATLSKSYLAVIGFILHSLKSRVKF